MWDFEVLLMNSTGRMHCLRGKWYYCLNSTRDFAYPLGWDKQVTDGMQNLFTLLGSMNVRRHQRANFWNHVYYPYLPWIRTNPSYDDLVFYALRDVPSPEDIEVTPEGKFMLRNSLVKEWDELEKMLLFLGVGLTHDTTIIRPRSPADLGYRKVHWMRAIAHQQALAAHDWFAVWMGFLSYFIGTEGISEERWKKIKKLVGNDTWCADLWDGACAEYNVDNP